MTDYEDGWNESKGYTKHKLSIQTAKTYIDILASDKYAENQTPNYVQGRIEAYKEYITEQLLKGELS